MSLRSIRPIEHDPYGRVGQVWNFDGSIELIIGWDRCERHITYVLDGGPYELMTGRFDHMAEDPLVKAEDPDFLSKYARIA